MHRTVSLDYAVVLIGNVKLTLESGEERVLAPGDVCIQRGTGHAWRNESATEWARMLFCVMACEPVVVEGEELGEYMLGEGKESLS